MPDPGARVRVRDDWPETRGPCHVRTPHYLRGRQGTVLRHLGDFANPEDLAFARPAALCPLYHVAFDRAAIWPDAAPAERVPGEPVPGELVVELFGHWLEPAP
jgi:nitrile hydratase